MPLEFKRAANYRSNSASCPSPLALLHGLGLAVGRLAEKVRDRSFTAPDHPERALGDS